MRTTLSPGEVRVASTVNHPTGCTTVLMAATSTPSLRLTLSTLGSSTHTQTGGARPSSGQTNGSGIMPKPDEQSASQLFTKSMDGLRLTSGSSTLVSLTTRPE